MTVLPTEDRRLCKHLGNLILTALLLLPFHLSAQNQARLENISDVSRWIDVHFGKGKLPPFSFTYDSAPSAAFITRWNYSKEVLRSDSPETVKQRITYLDPATGLKIECDVTGFRDFGAVEWVMRLSNTSGRNTPILDDFKVVDQTYESRQPGGFALLHALGSCGARADFMVSKSPLLPDSTLHIAPLGGRSSDTEALPFFNILAPGEKAGVMAAVGWTGGWQADLTARDERKVTLSSGMERFRLYLKPGETIRTPMICLVFWEGDDLMAGQNKFRRFQLAHHSRQIDGKFAEYPYAAGFAMAGPKPCTENGCLTEELAVAMARRMKQFNILPEVLWLDAGWYTDSGAPVYDWCDCVGTWTPDTTRFPRGLKPLADEAHRLGAKFLLWFEPERVSRGSWLAREHPDWLLHSPVRNSALLDLGNPETLEWLCTHVGDMIQETGIDMYRQDFNHPGKPFWEANEEPGRTGMMEIRHIEGLYAFWDYLIDRFPDILIDNCAAGGRRIDLETLSRSAPLWRTDYKYGESTGYQSHTYGLSFFLSQHGTGIYEPDDYGVRSSLGGSVVANWDLYTNRLNVKDIQRAIATFKECRPYFYGDYYPLTGIFDTTGDDIWLAYQLHDPKDDSGIVVGFRRETCPADRIKVSLRAVDPEKTYELYNDNDKLTQKVSGALLSEGVLLVIPQKRGSLLLRYRIAPES